MTKFFDGLKKAGETLISPVTNTSHGIEKIVGTVHNDIKGVTKGVYQIGSGLSKDLGTGITQLTSPVGLISIAVVIGAIALISMSRK